MRLKNAVLQNGVFYVCTLEEKQPLAFLPVLKYNKLNYYLLT